MATPDQIPTDLTLEIGVDLTPEAFVTAARHFFGYVKAIAATESEDQVAWRVKVKEGSNLIAVEAHKFTATSQLQGIYNRFRQGTRALMEGDLEAAELPEDALAHIRGLSQLTASKKTPVTMRFWVEREPVDLGPKIAEAIREDWRSDYHDVGSIEGRLQAIQEVNGGLKIRIKDPLYTRAVECKLPEKMIEEALATFRQRVEISGLIHYRRNGTPISIEVAAIEVLPDDDELPTADDVRGILAAG